MINVAIADSQPILREGIKRVLEEDPEIEVAGCAQDGPKILELCSRLSPDVVLMDIALSGDGIAAMKRIKERNKNIRIVIFTALDDIESIRCALANGADGYVMKDVRPDDLRLVIKNCVNGFNIISDGIMGKFITRYNSDERQTVLKSKKGEMVLLDREKDIVRLIILGKDTKEIAAALFLSEGRVKNIISDILRRMNLKDRTQLVVMALKKKWI